MTKTQDSFEQFLTRLEPQLPTAAEQYAQLRNKLIRYFKWNNCDDPDGSADETIRRLVKNIYSGHAVDKPSGYVYAIAKNVFREHLRKQKRLVTISDDLVPPSGEPDRFIECARHCVARLPDDKRQVLEQYYSDVEGRAEMAKRMGTSLPALRIKVHRIRAEVKDCYKKCIMGSK
jgi:DNA-directed RNA polymerase specialized sigma24 family protein